MLEENSARLKEHEMAIIYAGTAKDDDNSMTVIIDFASEEGMKNFAADEDSIAKRVAGGVLMDTVVMTQMMDIFVTNFAG